MLLLTCPNCGAECAETEFERLVPLSRRLQGEDDIATLELAQNLAAAYLLQEKYAEAEPYLRVAIADREDWFPETRALQIRAVYALASILHAQGKLDEAEQLYRDEMRRHLELPSLSEFTDGKDTHTNLLRLELQ